MWAGGKSPQHKEEQTTGHGEGKGSEGGVGMGRGVKGGGGVEQTLATPLDGNHHTGEGGTTATQARERKKSERLTSSNAALLS